MRELAIFKICWRKDLELEVFEGTYFVFGVILQQKFSLNKLVSNCYFNE